MRIIIPKTPLQAVLILTAGAIAALVFAYTAQYGFGLLPCELCLWQRYPYGIIIMLGIVLLLLRRKEELLLPGIALMALGYAADTGIAIYHSGVERDIFEGLSGCSGQLPDDMSLDALKNSILAAPAVRCDEPMGVVLGLSMANWNVLYALAWTAYALIILLKLRKKA